MSLVLSLGISAQAIHLFNDVPNLPANIHDATEWLNNRAITLGCAALLYCPNDFVTRAQMALFMQRLGVALTPIYVRNGTGSGALDPDASPVVCQTGTFMPTGYPRTAHVHSWVSLEPASTMSVILEVVISTNGGASWFNPDGGAGFARTGASVAGEWVHGYKDAVFSLTVGTSYMFGVRVSRQSGTADATDFRCTVTAEVINRNGASTPLSRPARRDGR
jgi:hypothetical protein